MLKNKRNRELNLLEQRDKMIEKYKNYFNINQNFFLTIERIYLSSQNLFEEFNYQKNLNFKQISGCENEIYKMNSYTTIISRVFSFINSLDKNLLSFNSNNKNTIFSIKRIKLPFNQIKVLEDEIIINFSKNNAKIFDNQFNLISSFNTKNQIERIIEIKKNYIAIFFYDDKNFEIWEKKEMNFHLKINFSLKTKYSCYNLFEWKNYIIQENNIIELLIDSDPKYYQLEDYSKGIIIDDNLIFYIKEDNDGEILFNFKKNKIIKNCNYEIYEFFLVYNSIIVCKSYKILFLNINNFQIETIIYSHNQIYRMNLFKLQKDKYFILFHNNDVSILNYETFEIIQKMRNCGYYKYFILIYGKSFFYLDY